MLGSLCVVLSVALFSYQAGCDITALALKKEQAEQLLALQKAFGKDLQKAADLGYEKGLVHGVEHFITHADSWLTEVKEKTPEVYNDFIKWVKRQGNSLSLVNSGKASSSTPRLLTKYAMAY